MNNSPERSKVETEKQEPTTAEIQNRMTRTNNLLTRLRAFPSDWVSKAGESKQDVEKRLEDALSNMSVMQETLSVSTMPAETNWDTLRNMSMIDKREQQSSTGILQERVVSRVNSNTDRVNESDLGNSNIDITNESNFGNSEIIKEQPRAKFFEVDGTYIPIMPKVSHATKEWEAVPSRMMMSGGKKFSEVKFVKDENGLTTVAKPGEKMNFIEGAKNERLESIDTLLSGRHELKTFNSIYEQLANTTSEYRGLNPDSPDYDQRATALADMIDSFTTPEGIASRITEKESEKLEDVEDFSERVADIISTLQYLREVDPGQTEFIPPIDHSYKMTPFIRKKFAEFAQLLNRQMGVGNNAYMDELVRNEQAPAWEKLSAKGMTVVVGPRGTGKNKLVDHYASISERPLFRYACSPDKEERDLTYDVELSDGEVVKVPTRILTAISTQNSILELDEINLLRPNVAKFFNSLFDGDRAVFLNDQVIHAAPGVMFVGLMNPADYNGVEDLPETIDDRSNIMTMGYPPLKERNRNTGEETFTYDEALILKNNISPLQGYSDAQFVQIWDRVVNSRGQADVSPEVVKIVRDLKNMVLIANRTRQTVEAYKTRTGDARIERDISLRGMSEATRYYSENHLWQQDLSRLPGWKAPWNAAQYAIAMTYLPHTETYRKGQQDKNAIEAILAEGVR